MAAGDVEANCRDERERVGVASLKELLPSSSRFAKDMLAVLLAKRVSGSQLLCMRDSFKCRCR